MTQKRKNAKYQSQFEPGTGGRTIELGGGGSLSKGVTGEVGVSMVEETLSQDEVEGASQIVSSALS